MSDDLLTLGQAQEALATALLWLKRPDKDIRVRAATRLEVAALRTAIAALEALEWRPIETAPKDGSRLLGKIGDWTGFQFYWDAHHSEWALCDAPLTFSPAQYGQDPTHWMPLPEPPKEKP